MTCMAAPFIGETAWKPADKAAPAQPPKLQKGVGGVAVDLPPVQNLGDDLADAVGGQPLLPRDLYGASVSSSTKRYFARMISTPRFS